MVHCNFRTAVRAAANAAPAGSKLQLETAITVSEPRRRASETVPAGDTDWGADLQ